MGSDWGFDTSPELSAIARNFRAAGDEKRSRAAAHACELAAAAVRLAGDDIAAALECLTTGRSDHAVAARLRGVSDGFDDEYLSIVDPDAPIMSPRAKEKFKLARAAAALSFGAAGRNYLHEAIYEALIALDCTSDVVSLIERELA
jgi:hypothetical protein